MPSPIGHALAGVAVAWVVESTRSQRTPPTTVSLLTVACATLAVLPDIDLLYMPLHRMATHSVTATLFITIVAAAVTGWVTGRVSWRVALACGAAYSTHLLLDWVGDDASAPYGIQPFWPFSAEWFISPWTLFAGTERRDPLSSRALLINLRALVLEIAILGPVVVALWFRRKRRNLGPTSGQDARQQPSA
jgi:inner membrane protein